MKATKISKKYPHAHRFSLEETSIDLPDRGFVFIIGRSGAGKTTLLSILALSSKPTSGTIEDAGIDLKYNSPAAAKYREEDLSCIYQTHDLISDLDVLDNLRLLEQDEQICLQLLRKVGLEDRAHAYPRELSGGERQRVTIVRGLAKNSKVFLVDEPTSSLDDGNAVLIYQILKEISKTALVVAVSHDMEIVSKNADRVIKMEKGRIVADRTIATIADSGNTSASRVGKPIRICRDLKKKLINGLSSKKVGSRIVKTALISFASLLVFSTLSILTYKHGFSLAESLRESRVNFVPLAGSNQSIAFEDSMEGQPLETIDFCNFKFYINDGDGEELSIPVYFSKTDRIRIEGKTVTLEDDVLYVDGDTARFLLGENKGDRPDTLTINPNNYTSIDYPYKVVTKARNFKFGDDDRSELLNRFCFAAVSSKTAHDLILNRDIYMIGDFAEEKLYFHAHNSTDLPAGVTYFSSTTKPQKNEIVMTKKDYERLSGPILHTKSRAAIADESYDFSKLSTEFEVVGTIPGDPNDNKLRIYFSDELYKKMTSDTYYFSSGVALIPNKDGLAYLNADPQRASYSYQPQITYDLDSTFQRVAAIKNRVALIFTVFVVFFIMLIVNFALYRQKKNNGKIFTLRAMGMRPSTVVGPYWKQSALEAGLYSAAFIVLSTVLNVLTNAVLGHAERLETGLFVTAFKFNLLAFTVPLLLIVLVQAIILIFNYAYISRVDISFQMNSRRR